MRAEYLILKFTGVLAIFSCFYAHTGWGTGGFYKSRGFDEMKCYEEVVKIECRQTCVLRVFPNSNGEITFTLGSEKKAFVGYQLTKFKFIHDAPAEAKLLEHRPLLSFEAKEILRKRGFVSSPVDCQ